MPVCPRNLRQEHITAQAEQYQPGDGGHPVGTDIERSCPGLGHQGRSIVIVPSPASFTTIEGRAGVLSSRRNMAT